MFGSSSGIQILLQLLVYLGVAALVIWINYTLLVSAIKRALREHHEWTSWLSSVSQPTQGPRPGTNPQEPTDGTTPQV